MTDKINRLVDYCQGLYQGQDGSSLYKTYLEEIKSITPEELIQVEHQQLQMGMSPKEMLTIVDKLMNVFHEGLSRYQLSSDLPVFVKSLIAENNSLKVHLEGFKEDMKQDKLLDRLDALLDVVKTYNVHLEKLENIVFSFLERQEMHFEGLKIMWSLHDDIRHQVKDMKLLMANNHDFVVAIGKLFFLLYGAIKKQEYILLPVLMDKASSEELDAMYEASFDFGFAFIDPPKPPKEMVRSQLTDVLTTPTGTLPVETLILILNVLPVDFTFVNNKDEVVYFNDNKERIFPRSASVIGRNVKHCHPPESVHIVESILTAFRNKTQVKAEFWIQMKGKIVYIYYIPLYDHEGQYEGTLEVSQEISKIKALQGERRLLDWE